MVMDTRDKPMTHFDWTTLFPRSHYRVVRVDLPVPLDKGGIYLMQRQLTKLIYDLGEAAEEEKALNRARSVKAGYEAFKLSILHMQRDWSGRYQELYKEEIARKEPQELTDDEAETLHAKHVGSPLHVVSEGT